MRIRKLLLMLSIMALFMGLQMFGKSTTASLSGTIRNDSGKAVADTKIMATNTETGDLWGMMTDRDGEYSFTTLSPGQYEVRAEHSGYRIKVQDGVLLTAGDEQKLNLTIEKERK